MFLLCSRSRSFAETRAYAHTRSILPAHHAHVFPLPKRGRYIPEYEYEVLLIGNPKQLNPLILNDKTALKPLEIGLVLPAENPD